MREFSISQNTGKYGCRHEHHRSDQEYIHSFNEGEILISYRNIDSLLNEEIEVFELSFSVIINGKRTTKYFYQSSEWKLKKIIDAFQYKKVDISKDEIKKLNFRDTEMFLHYLREKQNENKTA